MTLWKEALGYVEAPPPEGFESWEDWLRQFEMPEDEWDTARADHAARGSVGRGRSNVLVATSSVSSDNVEA